MAFHAEPNGCVYGIFSALQGAFLSLRNAIVNLGLPELQNRLLFHMDEAMSWESIRDLSRMKNALLLIENIFLQERITGDILEWVEDIRGMLDEVSDMTDV